MRGAYGEPRCASVKQRTNMGRRISAAELESLMVRQGAGQHYHPLPYGEVVSVFASTPTLHYCF